LSAALLVALAALAGPLASEGARRSPVRVEADEAQYAFQKREVTFSGRKPVTLRRDDATLTCKKIVAVTDEAGQIVAAACTGDVRFSRGLRTVTCEQATFDNATDRVVCEGNAVLRDAGSEARGTRLVYDLRSDEAKLEGATITLPGEEIDERQRGLEEKRRKERRP
jgi:lipopolysaccharide export system protein LptA